MQSHTHAYDAEDGLVVFHIGMTLAKPLRIDQWGPVVRAMPRMIAELERNRDEAARGEAEDLGFLGSIYLVGGKGPWLVQYWRSVDQLYAYASDRTREHLPAWRAFTGAASRAPGAVGIWHETYVVPAGGIETLYGNGARVGLGAVAGTVPVERRGRRAKERLAGSLTP